MSDENITEARELLKKAESWLEKPENGCDVDKCWHGDENCPIWCVRTVLKLLRQPAAKPPAGDSISKLEKELKVLMVRAYEYPDTKRVKDLITTITKFLNQLAAKPDAGTFTKETQKMVFAKTCSGGLSAIAILDRLKEACDRYDAEVAKNKELEAGQLDFAKEMEKILKSKIEQINELEAENKRLRKYARHLKTCKIMTITTGDTRCDCGFT